MAHPLDAKEARPLSLAELATLRESLPHRPPREAFLMRRILATIEGPASGLPLSGRERRQLREREADAPPEEAFLIRELLAKIEDLETRLGELSKSGRVLLGPGCPPVASGNTPAT